MSLGIPALERVWSKHRFCSEVAKSYIPTHRTEGRITINLRRSNAGT